LHSIGLPFPGIFDLESKLVLRDNKTSGNIPVLARCVRPVVTAVSRAVATVLVFKVGLVGEIKGVFVLAHETSSLIGRRFAFI
jgi:hypothetical protein